MRISQLEVKNIGPFESETIDFKRPKKNDRADIHILTGVNGSGKSTILYALAGAFNFFAVQNRFRYQNEQSYIKIQVDDNLEQIIVHDENGRLSYPSPPKSIDDYARLVHHTRVVNPQTKKLDFAVFAYSGDRSLSSANIKGIVELDENPLDLSLNFRNTVTSQILLQWIANNKAKSSFASQAGNKDDAEKYQRSLSRIEEAVKEIVGYDVQFIISYEPLSVSIKINNEELEFDVLPDGLKSIVSFIADLLMRLERLKWVDNREVLDRSFILFLDEIEIHLHPAWQRKILPVIQKLFKNAQIFIATHSPFVVASVNDAWVYKLEIQENGKAKLAKVEEAMAGSSYSFVLDTIFDIEDFDVETERLFEQFYQLKQELLTGNDKNLDEFRKLSRTLIEKSVEVKDIVGRELRQLQRLSGREIV